LTGGTHTGSGLTGSHNTHGTTGSGLTGSHNTHGTTGSGLTGSHNTHGTTGSGLTGSHKTHGTTGYGSNTHGTTGGLGGSATHGSDPSGPHDSKLANKLDPTVDTKSYGTVQGGHPKYDSNTTGSGLTGSHNTHGTTGYGSNTHGTTGGLTGGSHNTHGTTGGLTGGTHNTHGTTGYSDPTGPHDSHLVNKADPRVDSDRYGAAGNTSGAGGYGTGQYGEHTGSHGTTGGLGSSTTHRDGEPLPKALTEDVSRADHRSGHSHTGATGGGLTGTHGQHGAGNVGSGNSNTTAGPHNSDLLNKIDPRVDSDLNGSKTVGGNQTYR
tara:strand:+ start:2319 stop:3287 length:969 start_codon:yes stop_codon:yes gene_type:complete